MQCAEPAQPHWGLSSIVKPLSSIDINTDATHPAQNSGLGNYLNAVQTTKLRQIADNLPRLARLTRTDNARVL